MILLQRVTKWWTRTKTVTLDNNVQADNWNPAKARQLSHNTAMCQRKRCKWIIVRLHYCILSHSNIFFIKKLFSCRLMPVSKRAAYWTLEHKWSRSLKGFLGSYNNSPSATVYLGPLAYSQSSAKYSPPVCSIFNIWQFFDRVCTVHFVQFYSINQQIQKEVNTYLTSTALLHVSIIWHTYGSWWWRYLSQHVGVL
jgi:hypothetical protein